MACCKCCCGGEDCTEGQEGKCCCGGSGGTCCQEGEYCCSGSCEPNPCEGCCCVNYAPDPELTTQEDCELAGGTWLLAPCDPDPCGALYDCRAPSEWRIVDAADNIYAQGDIVDNVLENLPNPWTPEFYYTLDPFLTLEVNGCVDGWDALDTWSPAITLCGTTADRYPSQPLGGPWPPPAGCDCAYDVETEEVVDPCIPCPELTAGSGTGQEWRSPQPGVAVTFTGAIDGEWTNLLNWEDADGNSPASELPSGNVTIEGSVTSVPPDYSASVGVLTIAAGGAVNIPIAASGLECYGSIDRNSICDDMFGIVAVSGDAFVYGGGVNNGEIVNAVVKFSGDGKNDTQGVVTGDARFDGGSRNDGTITGDAEFYDDSVNDGAVLGDAAFNESSQNLFAGTLFNDATFNNSSKNYGAATSGDIAFTGSSENHYLVGVTTFTDSAINKAAGVVAAGTFSGTSSNAGLVSVDAVFGDSATNSGTVGGFATFNDSAANNSGTVYSAEFNGSSTNSGTVLATATFNDDTVNAAAGVVSTDATFNDDSIHRGAVTGTATFNDCSYNDGGTAGTFVPSSPPTSYPC